MYLFTLLESKSSRSDLGLDQVGFWWDLFSWLADGYLLALFLHKFFFWPWSLFSCKIKAPTLWPYLTFMISCFQTVTLGLGLHHMNWKLYIIQSVTKSLSMILEEENQLHYPINKSGKYSAVFLLFHFLLIG